MAKEFSNLKPGVKIPPQDIEAEKSALGSLLMDKDAIIKVADFLRAEDFYKQNHQEIYLAIESLFSKGEPIDLISISSILKGNNKLENIGGVAYLTELINTVPTASHVLSYAKIVQKKRILRDLIVAGEDITLLGYNEAQEADKLLDEAGISSAAPHCSQSALIKAEKPLAGLVGAANLISSPGFITLIVPGPIS
jgi:replicative DNA helicase